MIVPAGFPKLPSSFEYETEVLQSTDGENGIFLNWFKKKNTTPKRTLMIIHGQGEHGGRYQHFPHYLQDQYDVILAPDLRGHGRSEGIRGHVETFDEYVDDALLAWDALGTRIPKNATRDWFGHSMGGTVSLRAFSYQQNLEARNLILSSPCLDLTVEVPLVKRVAANLLSKIWGSLQMETGLDPKTLSHDPAVVEAIIKDQLHHTKATPQFYLSFVETMAKLRESEIRFNPATRVLFQIAGEDLIVSREAAEKFFDQMKHELKKKVVYTGLFHEIFNETSKENVFEDLITFIKEGETQ